MIDPVLVYSTYAGVNTAPVGIAVDAGGNAYITGFTQTSSCDSPRPPERSGKQTPPASLRRDDCS